MFIASRSLRKLRGLTMVEMVLFIIVVSIAMAGVLLILNMTTSHSGDAQLRKQALSIAEAILEEVEMARYTYCDPADANALTATAYTQCAAGSTTENVGPESGNTRPYDNVNDYATGKQFGVPYNFTLVDVNGNPIVPPTGTYSATVMINQASLPGMESDPGANPAVGSTLLIQVTVTYGAPGNTQTLTLEGYRTQYAPNLIP